MVAGDEEGEGSGNLQEEQQEEQQQQDEGKKQEPMFITKALRSLVEVPSKISYAMV